MSAPCVLYKVDTSKSSSRYIDMKKTSCWTKKQIVKLNLKETLKLKASCKLFLLIKVKRLYTTLEKTNLVGDLAASFLSYNIVSKNKIFFR